MSLNRQWVLAKRPDGPIGPENFAYVEAGIPDPNDGEVLIRNLYFSFDPTQRNMMVDQPAISLARMQVLDYFYGHELAHEITHNMFANY